MSHRIHDNLVEITAEKEKADLILRCMIEGVVVLDPKGNVLVINDRAKEMFHVPAGREVRGASVLELTRHPEIRAILNEVLKFDFTSNTYRKEIELEEGAVVPRQCRATAHRPAHDLGLDPGLS